MAKSNSRQVLSSSRLKFQIKAAAILLGIYVAMYLAVGVLIHVSTPSGASADAESASIAPSTTAAVPAPQAGTGEARPLPQNAGMNAD